MNTAFPMGIFEYATVGHFGIEVWRGEDGHFSTASDPTHPVLTLTIAGNPHPENIPAGTEIWLREARHQTTAKGS